MKFNKPTNNTPSGALAVLWRRVIKENNLEGSLGFLISRYLDKYGGDSKQTKRKTRSTLEADITAPEMTWKKFTNLIFNYLGAIKMDVSIKLYFPNGKTSVHNVTLVPSDPNTDDLEDEKEDE